MVIGLKLIVIRQKKTRGGGGRTSLVRNNIEIRFNRKNG